MNPAHKEFAEKMLGEIHQQFITVVRNGRGKRLKESPEIFSGLVWVGQKSIELGLADALGSVESGRARRDQGRGCRRLYAAREHRRARRAQIRRGDGGSAA